MVHRPTCVLLSQSGTGTGASPPPLRGRGAVSSNPSSRQLPRGSESPPLRVPRQSAVPANPVVAAGLCSRRLRSGLQCGAELVLLVLGERRPEDARLERLDLRKDLVR